MTIAGDELHTYLPQSPVSEVVWCLTAVEEVTTVGTTNLLPETEEDRHELHLKHALIRTTLCNKFWFAFCH